MNAWRVWAIGCSWKLRTGSTTCSSTSSPTLSAHGPQISAALLATGRTGAPPASPSGPARPGASKEPLTGGGDGDRRDDASAAEDGKITAVPTSAIRQTALVPDAVSSALAATGRRLLVVARFMSRARRPGSDPAMATGDLHRSVSVRGA